MFNLKNKGFTLIELLVVISIISILSSIAFASLKSAREKAMYAKSQSDLSTIKKAMHMYKLDVGELPPRGDSWTIGNWPNNAAQWDTNVMEALLNSDGAGWAGPYLSKKINLDPWGNYYTFDDNDCNANCGDTYIRTVGVDGVPYTGDDYEIKVTGVGELTSCSIPCY